MAFMLGSFVNGITQGAKDIYGLENEYANTQAINERTAMEKQDREQRAAAFKAGQDVVNQTNVSQPALPVSTQPMTVTPSSSGTSGGGPGTTTNGPVAPLNFDKAVPQPTFLAQSQPGTPGGFGPSYNPETGPAAAATQAQPAVGSSPIPMPQAPTLANSSDRTQPTASAPAAPSQPQQQSAFTTPLAQQHIDMNTPVLQQIFPWMKPGSTGVATPTPAPAPAAPTETASPPPSPHRQRAMDKSQKSAPQQTSSNNLGRKMASVLNVG